MVAIHGWNNFLSMITGWKRNPEYVIEKADRLAARGPIKQSWCDEYDLALGSTSVWTGRTMSSNCSSAPYYSKEAESRYVLPAALHFSGQSEVPPDAALPEQLVQKDARAFERLYDLYSRTVYSLVFRIVRQTSIAEEVVQDVFLHLWRNAAQYDSARGPFVPWLLTLARNRAFDHLRLKGERQRRREELPETLPQIVMTPGYEAALDEKRRAAQVRELMCSLYPQQKRAIEMAYFEGLSHSEIAAAMSEPLGTVKSWIRNGLQRLREGLQATS